MARSRSWKQRTPWAVLALAVALGSAGLAMAALAGAEGGPSVRQGAYGEPTCDDPSQTLDTRITKAPKKKTSKSSAKFQFEAFYCNFPDEDPADPEFVSFSCKLDKKGAKACTSPQRYGKLKDGKHKFRVAASFSGSDAGGDPTPAKHRWKIAD